MRRVLGRLAVAQHQRGVVVGPIQRRAVDQVGEHRRPRPIVLATGAPCHRFQVCLRIVHDHLTWQGGGTFKRRPVASVATLGRYDAGGPRVRPVAIELEDWG